MTRTRYRYLGRIGDVMCWESVRPISERDSRHERIMCDWDWFWGKR